MVKNNTSSPLARSLARSHKTLDGFVYHVFQASLSVCAEFDFMFFIFCSYFFPLPLLTSCESAVREEIPSSWTLFLMQKQVLMCDPPNKGRNPPHCFLVGSCKFLHTYFICRAIGVQLARLCNLCLFKCVMSSK